MIANAVVHRSYLDDSAIQVSRFDSYVEALEKIEVRNKIILQIEQIYGYSHDVVVFGESDVKQWLDCSRSKAINLMKAMKEIQIITRGE